MNTVHILTDRVAPFHKGGLEASVLRIAKIIMDLGLRVFIYHTDSTDLNDSVKIDDVQYVSLYDKIRKLLVPLSQQYKINDNYNRVASIVLLSEIKKRMKHNGDKAIILSFYSSSKGFIAQRVADELNISHITSVRGSDYSCDSYIGGRMSILEYVYRNCDKIITTNESQKRGIGKLFNIDEKKIVTIYNSTDNNIPIFRPNLDKIVIFSDQGYSFKKGTHILFESLSYLIADNVDIYVTICGPTASSEEVYWSKKKQCIKDLSPDRITLLDYESNVTKFYNRSSIYITSSLAEGCPNALLSALYSGIPVISSNVGFIPELSSRIDGLWVADIGDAKQLTDKIRTAIAYSNNIRCYDERRELMRDSFSKEKESISWKEVFAI